MKRIWAIRKDAEAVSPVIATILMVAITVVLAAVLYVMVLGFGGTSQQTPTTQLTKSTVAGGVKLTLAAVSIETLWTDIDVLISDGTNSVGWADLASTDLDDVAGDRMDYGPETLGSVTVTLNVTDLSGNGYANQGDYFTVTGVTFLSTATYTITLIYGPTASSMTTINFNG